MNGKKCSWVTMRKIKKILSNEGMSGEYGALVACVTPGAVSNWRAAIKVMDAIQISEKAFKHVQPSHTEEIGRRVKDPEQWAQWVKKCEKAKWTVAELRQELQSTGKPVVGRVANSLLTTLSQCIRAVQRAKETPARLQANAKVLHTRLEELERELRELKQAVRQASAA